MIKHWNTKENLETAGLNILLLALYFCLAKLGLFLATINHNVSPVWPATGLAFSIIYIYGYRVLPAVALGAFFANLSTEIPFTATLLITIGNTLEAAIGAAVLKHIYSLEKQFSYQTESIAIIAASCLGSVFSATIGVSALIGPGTVVNGHIPKNAIFSSSPGVIQGTRFKTEHEGS